MRIFAAQPGLPPLLALLTLLALTDVSTHAGSPEPVVIVTATGHRLAGLRVPAASPAFLGLVIGRSTYELERRGSRLEGSDLAMASNPAWEAFVGELITHLGGDDPVLEGAARQGLLALGEAGVPYLERALADAGGAAGAVIDATTDDSVADRRDALRALLRALEGAPR